MEQRGEIALVMKWYLIMHDYQLCMQMYQEGFQQSSKRGI